MNTSVRVIAWLTSTVGLTCGVLLSTLVGCAPADTNSPGSRGYGAPPPPPYFGNGYYGDARSRDFDFRERRRLENERIRLEEERRKLEIERKRKLEIERKRRGYPPLRPVPRPTVKPVERCPSGYLPSERKCTAKERALGCKDIRLPGGLGCVNRSLIKRKRVR